MGGVPYGRVIYKNKRYYSRDQYEDYSNHAHVELSLEGIVSQEHKKLSDLKGKLKKLFGSTDRNAQEYSDFVEGIEELKLDEQIKHIKAKHEEFKRSGRRLNEIQQSK